VYLLEPYLEQKEFVMYDFSVLIGDTVIPKFLIDCYNSSKSDLESFKIIKGFNYYYDETENMKQIITTYNDTLIEGIGWSKCNIKRAMGGNFSILYAKYGEDTLFINREYQDAINSIKEGNTWNKTVCTGINENEIDKNTRFVFFDNTIIDNENKSGMYYLYNTQGALISKANYNKEINLEYLKTGLYFINILTENKTFKMKILINKEL